MEKLKRRIRSGIACEEDAVFLMVKVRKLLEREGLKETLTTITFYCDWSVHTVMNGTGAQTILGIIDQFVADDLPSLRKFIQQTLSLSSLRDEFRDLCNRYELPLELVESEKQWLGFRDLLAANLSDCDLEANEALPNIRSLSFHCADNRISAIIALKKGEIISIEE